MSITLPCIAMTWVCNILIMQPVYVNVSVCSASWCSWMRIGYFVTDDTPAIIVRIVQGKHNKPEDYHNNMHQTVLTHLPRIPFTP